MRREFLDCLFLLALSRGENDGLRGFSCSCVYDRKIKMIFSSISNCSLKCGVDEENCIGEFIKPFRIFTLGNEFERNNARGI